jgi:hypothetical protein
MTILLHKKGNRAEVSNWRPISLSNTIAKIYASVLVSRLGNWASRNDRISADQKGFMPVDGCAEHNFTLQSVIVDARRARKECAIAWLDLTNAFGSVPHETIFYALQWAGLHDDAIEVIRRLYASCTTTIRSRTGPTPQIAIRAGVKQGCPLSPIIFNLTIEPILRAATRQPGGYQLYDINVEAIAYADNLALIATTAAELQGMLDAVGRVAAWAGLAFNAWKCATLHMDGRKHEALQTMFTIQGGQPEVLTEKDV